MNIWAFCNKCRYHLPDTNYDFTFNNYNPLPQDHIDINNILIPKKKKEIPGLSNFEGNCYLNSVLQCIYYCDDLKNYFTDNETDIKKNNGKLTNAYLNLILRLDENEKYNNAKHFLNALQDVSLNFFNRGGNDPKAVLLYLLENFHNELKEKNLFYNEEDICCEGIDKEQVFKKCRDNEQNNKSIISELFSWCLITCNECFKCGNNHYKCEYRNNILIELKAYKTTDEYVNLDVLINFYFQDIIQNFMCCFNKNNDKEVIKMKFTQKIMSLPKYLIIILNRDIIKFNVIYNDIIDLSEYYVGKNNAKYEFIGVSLTNDFGNKEGTHAISRCITPKGSFIFNDLYTKESDKDISGYNPYILFYKKIK